MARRDSNTIDMFRDFEPPEVAPTYPREVLAAATQKALVCKTLACALERDPRSREVIADHLSKSLGETISEGQIDNWTSAGKETNNIHAYRLVALVSVLLQADRPDNAIELLNSLFKGSGLMVCEERYRDLLDSQLMLEASQKYAEAASIAAAKWKAQS